MLGSGYVVHPDRRGGSFVIGRLFWDADHPSPWMYFRTQTVYDRWARDIRRARPGTKTERQFVNVIWNAPAMLADVRDRSGSGVDPHYVSAGDTMTVSARDLVDPDEEKEEDMPDSVTDRKAYLERRMREMDAELQRIDALPKEPIWEVPDEPNAIFFIKTFGYTGGREFTYAAVRAGDGLWYATGPRAPKGFPWAELIAWIQDGEPGPVPVWWAVSFDQIC